MNSLQFVIALMISATTGVSGAAIGEFDDVVQGKNELRDDWNWDAYNAAQALRALTTTTKRPKNVAGLPS